MGSLSANINLPFKPEEVDEDDDIYSDYESSALYRMLPANAKEYVAQSPHLLEYLQIFPVNLFGIPLFLGRETKKRYIDALNEFLLKNFSSGRNAVILIDEAQNLSLSVLEQIRLLSNLETEREKLLQIVLFAQPELQDLLSTASLRQLNERITVRYEIEPLDKEQVHDYIEHRLNIARENNGNLVFSQGAYKTIFDYSKGIPRRINAICDRALLIAYTKDTYSIDKKMITQAVNDIGRSYLTKENASRKMKNNFLIFLLIFIIFLLFGLVITMNWDYIVNLFPNTISISDL